MAAVMTPSRLINKWHDSLSKMIAGLLLLHNLAANEVNSDIGPLKFEFVLPHSNFNNS